MSQDRGQSPPTVLPDALHGLHSPVGRPGYLSDMCRDFANAATQLDDVATDLASLLIAERGAWEGPAEHAFLGVASFQPRILRGAAAGYREAAGAVQTYVSALEHAQQTYAAARTLIDTDEARQLSRYPAVPLDLFSPDRVRARSQVEAAMDRLRGATLRTAGVLKALEATLGRRPHARPEIDRGKRTSMLQASDEILDKQQADLGALWALHRLVTPSQAGQAWGQAYREYKHEARTAMDHPIKYIADEAYATANMDELIAGNYARWAAGAGYNVATRVPGKLLRWFSPDGKRKGEDRAKGTQD